MIPRVKSTCVCVGLLAAVTVAVTPTPAAAVDFGPPSYTGVWGDPFAIATPDFNGDGHPDLVAGIAGEGFSEVVTLLGNGHGGFEREEQYEPGGAAVFALTVADLDGDGHLDIATALDGAPGEDISILRGEAGGYFNSTATRFNAGEDPQAIAAARFSGRALPDLVVGNVGSENISLLENESKPGTLAFKPAGPFAPGYVPVAIAVADFNQDGIPDVVAADSAKGANRAIRSSTAPAKRAGSKTSDSQNSA
jgi:hypothetical protein